MSGETVRLPPATTRSCESIARLTTRSPVPSLMNLPAAETASRFALSETETLPSERNAQRDPFTTPSALIAASDEISTFAAFSSESVETTSPSRMSVAVPETENESMERRAPCPRSSVVPSAMDSEAIGAGRHFIERYAWVRILSESESSESNTRHSANRCPP